MFGCTSVSSKADGWIEFAASPAAGVAFAAVIVVQVDWLDADDGYVWVARETRRRPLRFRFAAPKWLAVFADGALD